MTAPFTVELLAKFCTWVISDWTVAAGYMAESRL